MDRPPHEYLTRRWEGRRRAGAVTAWSAAAGTGLTVAFGTLFAQTGAAAPAPADAVNSPLPAIRVDDTTPETAPTRTSYTPPAPRSTSPTTSGRPTTSHTLRTALAPPPALPKASSSSGGRRHASSGAS